MCMRIDVVFNFSCAWLADLEFAVMVFDQYNLPIPPNRSIY